MKFKIKYFNGKTAIDLARLKKNEKIYNILMEFKKNIKSSELKKSKTTRPDNAPFEFVHDGHIYKYYYSTINSFVYLCSNGINHHKTNKIKCEAKISIPKTITPDDYENVQVTIINSNHSCTTETGIIKRMILDSFLKSKVEEIFNSQPLRPTKQQVITKLYEYFDKTTPEGEEMQTFSESLVNNYYVELVKKNNQEDADYQDVLRTERKDIFELFKHRLSDGNSCSFIICYCSNFQKECIPNAEVIFIDGTFNVAPKDFAQVLVILGQTTNMNLPLAYFLLPDKKQETYEKAFSMFKMETKASFRKGVTFITDFEKAEIRAVKKCLMEKDSVLQLCYFHFCQSMWRHFQKYQKSQIISELNSIANLLPFIPEQKVTQVIDELYTYEETKRFAKYFEKHYLNAYDFNDWSVYPKPRKETITNNVAESHNNMLGRRIGDQPSLKTFETIIKDIEKEYQYRYKTREYSSPTILRIDEDMFNEKYRSFISKLRRLNSKEKEQQEWFKDSETSDEFGISEASVTSNETLDENINHTLKSNSDEIIHNDFNNISDSKDSDDLIIEADHNDEIEATDSNKERKQVEENPKKEKSKANTRNLPKEGKEILLKYLPQFIKAPPRSDERKQIIEFAHNEIHDIDQDIDINSIRLWFYNHKNKTTDS